MLGQSGDQFFVLFVCHSEHFEQVIMFGLQFLILELISLVVFLIEYDLSGKARFPFSMVTVSDVVLGIGRLVGQLALPFYFVEFFDPLLVLVPESIDHFGELLDFLSKGQHAWDFVDSCLLPTQLFFKLLLVLHQFDVIFRFLSAFLPHNFFLGAAALGS